MSAVAGGGGCLDIFSLSCRSLFFLPLSGVLKLLTFFQQKKTKKKKKTGIFQIDIFEISMKC